MVKTILSALLLLSISGRNTAQTTMQASVQPRFSADTVRNMIGAVTNELRRAHPGFLRYYSKEDLQQYIDSVKHTVVDSLTLFESFLKIKPIISKIGCLHTGRLIF